MGAFKTLLLATVLVPVPVLAQTATPEPPAATEGAAPPEAQAQGQGDPEATNDSGDIVVTATRREQNLQDIPIAISAIGSEALQDQKISNVLDMQGIVPGLQINRNNAVTTFTLRGVGTNFRVQGVDNTVALHQDGVYISSSNAAQAAFFDVERIEVVRGPQGVLYGRNASGGAVNIITKLPTREFSGYGLATYGNYDLVELEGAVSGPIVDDKVLVRVGGYYRNRDGYGRNNTLNEDHNDLDERGVKATLQFKPTDDVNLIVRGDYYKADDNSSGTEALPGSAPGRPRVCLPTPAACAPGLTRAETLGGVIATRPRDTNGNVPTRRDLEVWGVSGEGNFDLSGPFGLKTLTAYRKVDAFVQTDQDATRLSVNDPFQQSVKGWQFSQELQLNYTAPGVFGIFGLYYFQERRDARTFLAFPALDFLPPPNFGDVFQLGNNKTKAFAVFANVDFDLSDRLTVGLGGRYSYERKSTEGFNVTIFGPLRTVREVSRDWRAFTPRATLNFEVTPDTNLYASVSRGFKSGQFALATPTPAEPEFLWDYEAGVKGRAFDGKLRYTFGGFYYDFNNLQLQLFSGPVNSITNAPGGEAYGLEASADVDLPAGFRFHGDVTWEKSQYQGLVTDNPNTGQANVDLSGNTFAYTPEWSYTISLEKDVDFGSAGRGTFRIENQYNGDTYLDIYQNRVNGFRDDYHIINAHYRHELPNGFSVLLWGRNLTGEDVIMASNFGIGNIGSTRLVNWNPPRTYGITIKKEFGW